MLKIRLLKNIFLAAIISAVVLLTYLYVVVHPAYRELLIENAEDEAVRFASFLVASQNIDKPVSQLNLPPHIAEEVGRLHGDEQLIKLRIFSPKGEIAYSTLPKEIGTLNKHDYFHNHVAAGRVYSKTVQKDAMTAEMEIVSTDLVETYVPIMVKGRFLGAIETYYDITLSNNKITALTQHSLALLSCLAVILLSLLYYALHHADLSIRAREDAENNLRRANEDLEQRVADRAGELVEANRNLTREITERTLAQMALSEALSEMRQDKEKISGILRSVDDGLLVIDSANQILMMNAPAEEILAVAQADVIGAPLSQAVADSKLYEKFSSLLFSDTMPHIDFESAATALNQVRVFQARTSKLRDEDGFVHGRIILMQDVTQERRLEEMKSDFLAMAAHELSTPLATIIGYADLLSGEHAPELSPAIQQESLNFIHEKANALSRIIDDLLDVSRAESGQELSINKVSFNLNQTLKSLVAHYTERHTERTIKLELPNSNGEITADPTRIGQILDNLMSNAIKYTPAGGHILLKSMLDDDCYRIEIIDDGVGMTPEQLKHIFDKFYRADGSNTAKPGIGLGMSITKHLVEGHNGTISVQSEPGQGTRVVFRLPIISA